MSKAKIDKKTIEAIEKERSRIAKMKPGERDTYLAAISVYIEKLLDLVESIAEQKTGEKKLADIKDEAREIEEILSVGPKWLNYTIKTKNKKSGK